MKSHLLIILTFFAISQSLNAQTLDTLNIEQCLSAGAEQFGLTKTETNANEIVRLQDENIRRNYYPTLKLEGQATLQSDVITLDLPLPGVNFPEVPKDQYKAYAEINQLIFDGGRTKAYANLNAASQTENSAKIELARAELNNALAALFFNISLIDKQLEILNAGIASLQTQKKTIESGIKNGVLTPVNRDLIDLEILKTEQKINEIKSQKRLAVELLKKQTGLDISEQTTLLPYAGDTLENSVKPNPRLLMLDIQSEKADLNSKLISTARMPQVFAFAQAGYARPGLNMLSSDFTPYYIGGVKLSWQIYDWGQTKRKTQISELGATNIALEKENTQTSIFIKKQSKATQIQTLKESVITDEKLIDLQKKIVNIYSKQVANGTLKTSEYLIEINKLTQAELALELHLKQIEQAEFEYNNIY